MSTPTAAFAPISVAQNVINPFYQNKLAVLSTGDAIVSTVRNSAGPHSKEWVFSIVDSANQTVTEVVWNPPEFLGDNAATLPAIEAGLPVIAVDGGFVAVWLKDNVDESNGNEIRAQMFNESGVAVGDTIRVVSAADVDQRSNADPGDQPFFNLGDIVIDSDGDVVVSFRFETDKDVLQNNYNTDTMAVQISLDGSGLQDASSPFFVEGGDDVEVSANLRPLPNGGWYSIAGTNRLLDNGFLDFPTLISLFDENGMLIQQLDIGISNADRSQDQSVALSSGDFAYFGWITGTADVGFTIFDSSGNILSETTIQSMNELGFFAYQDYRLLQLPDGTFAALWRDDVVANLAHLDTDGALLGEIVPYAVDHSRAPDWDEPELWLTKDGDIALSWTEFNALGQQVVYYQEFDFGGDGSDDGYTGTDGDDVIIGDDETNTLVGLEGEDDLFGGKGSDELFGGDDNDLLNGGADADILYGDKGSDQFVGGQGDDILFGGKGNDKLRGSKGDDTMEGGLGRDTFFMKEDWGDDVATDFTDGQDKVRIYTYRFDDLTITQQGADTLIAFGEASILLMATDMGDITASDFVFT